MVSDKAKRAASLTGAHLPRHGRPPWSLPTGLTRGAIHAPGRLTRGYASSVPLLMAPGSWFGGDKHALGRPSTRGRVDPWGPAMTGRACAGQTDPLPVPRIGCWDGGLVVYGVLARKRAHGTSPLVLRRGRLVALRGPSGGFCGGGSIEGAPERCGRGWSLGLNGWCGWRHSSILTQI